MHRFTKLAVVLAALVVLPGTSLAATFGAEVFGAYNTYKMEDANDAIDVLNASGNDFDDLNGGLGGGLGARMWANPNWMFAATWEPLFLETKDDATDESINMDANSYQFTAGYFFPTAGNAKYGLGGGVGYYSVAGESEISGVTESVDGGGMGFHALGMGEWTVSPGFAITGSAGYRFADIELDDVPSDITAEYTGFMGRVGLAFYLPSGQ